MPLSVAAINLSWNLVSCSLASLELSGLWPVFRVDESVLFLDRLVGAWGFGEYWSELVGVMFNGSRDDAEWRAGEGEIYACFHKFVGMPVL